MSELTSGASELDARLAEIDRRLRTIQTELVPGSAPRPAPELQAVPAAPELPADAGPEPESPPEPESLSDLAAQPHPAAQPDPAQDPGRPPGSSGRSGPLAALLLASRPPTEPLTHDPIRDLSELTELHERLLATMRDLLGAYESVISRLSAASAAVAMREFAVAAGPFESTEALRAFERTLSGLPGVREVAVREYEGEDRAIVDVHLTEPTS